MEQKIFKKNDQSFICHNCSQEVKPLGYTSRDHCPYCLYSLHVDINPGDRLNPCKGTLKPVGLQRKKDTYQIIYICEKCHQEVHNIIASDDNQDLIIKLSQNN